MGLGKRAAVMSMVLLYAVPSLIYFQVSCRLEPATEDKIVHQNKRHQNNSQAVHSDHWVYVYNDELPPPYVYSQEVCDRTNLDPNDCRTTKSCSSDLMNWVYIKDGEPYPRFDAKAFLQKMKNKSIVFIGSSLMRQQVSALMWTLGYDNIKPPYVKTAGHGPDGLKNCTASRKCFTDHDHNITLCWQFMGSLATKVYHEGNLTLDHSLRGQGDSSCILEDKWIAEFQSFDLVLVQPSIAWWVSLFQYGVELPTRPKTWVREMIPTMFYDSMKGLITKISQKTETVVVLGHTGVSCTDKHLPAPFATESIPDRYHWGVAPTIWNATLRLIEEERLDVKVVDVRDPVMQSVHAHPQGDCLHFCMNSAAINVYLDYYWNQVFSQ